MSKQIDQLLAKVSDLQRQGRLTEARELCLKMTQSEPRNALAWQMLGITNLQLGDPAQAASCMTSALALDPKLPGGHYNLGVIFHKMGRLQEAVAAYTQSIEAQPQDIQARLNLGAALRALGKTLESIEQYRKVVQLSPALADARFNLANALSSAGRHDEAIAEFQRATELNPKLIAAWVGFGSALRALGRTQDALEKFKRAEALGPNDAGVHFNIAGALSDMKRRDDAAARYARALALQPGFAEAHVNLGMLQLEMRDYENAAASFNRALAIRPDAKAHFNLATLYRATERYTEAFEHFDRAIALEPGDENTRAHKGLMALALEKFQQGWADYERRFNTPHSQMPPYPQPVWNGEKVDGTLLVWGEQGLGDQIIYASMIDELKRYADHVAIEVEPRLVPLFARSFPDLNVSALSSASDSTGIAAHASLASIGKVLRPGIESFSASQKPWLIPDSGQTKTFRDRLNDGHLVVGLSWASKNPHTQELKSAQLLQFEPVLKLAGCRFVDLQYGDTIEERAATQRELGITVEHLSGLDLTNDIDGLASLIAACDVVVTVSNTTAHLAGAVGTRTMVLLPHGIACPWYWFRERTDSPWYPSLTLYRQSRDESWGSLLERVATDLPASIR